MKSSKQSNTSALSWYRIIHTHGLTSGCQRYDTELMLKTRALHLSYQCLMLLACRRFPHHTVSLSMSTPFSRTRPSVLVSLRGIGKHLLTLITSLLPCIISLSRIDPFNVVTVTEITLGREIVMGEGAPLP